MTSELMAGPGGPAAQRSDSRRGAAAIVAALAGAGTRLMFGVPGGGPNLDVVGAAAAAGMSFVLAHGETAATIMAATCADLTGAPGAVVVTRGPGLASAVNGIAHAALDRLPVVVIADTVPGHQRDRVSHQRLDQAALGRSVAKAALTAGPGQGGPMAELAVRLHWRRLARTHALEYEREGAIGLGAPSGRSDVQRKNRAFRAQRPRPDRRAAAPPQAR